MKLPPALILAGGLGSRLKPEVPVLPKCMAPVAGKPFIDHLLQNLLESGVTEFVFALGYKSKYIIEHLEKHWKELNYVYSIETYALGTGGAIQKALSLISHEDFYVFNGDTLFLIDLEALYSAHCAQNAFITVALKPMENFDRYGSVRLAEDQKIIQFNEKTFCQSGLINGGIYLVHKKTMLEMSLPEVFSFEKDVLEKSALNGDVYGKVFDTYFIDIGIPEDYKKADADLQGNNKH